MSSAVPEQIPFGDPRGRSLFRLSLDSYAEWPEGDLQLASPHFVLLVIVDATSEDGEAEMAAARRALKQGVVFMCAWGPGCQHTEDTFDWAFLELPDAESRPVLMTTQHSSESLAEAVEFFLDAAWPDDAYQATCQSWLIATVGRFGADTDVGELVRRRHAGRG